MDAVAALKPVDQRGLDEATLAKSVLDKLVYAVGRDPAHAVNRDWGVALSLAVRDRIVDCWLPSTRRTFDDGRKRVYYLSLEFLIGRLLRDAMANLGITEPCRAALATFGVDFDEVLESEPDAALGNGGLGRLAACFLESLSRVGIAAFGYGIRYEHGLFRQSFRDGWQAEEVEDWLTMGHPWEFERPEVVYPIGFGGIVEARPGRAPDLAAERADPGQGLRHADPGLARRARQHAAPVVGAAGQAARSRPVQPRRVPAGGRAAGSGRDHLADPLSERFDARRPGAAAEAGVLLHLGLAAGPGAPLRSASTTTWRRSPTMSRSSSTTPIPRSPCRS